MFILREQAMACFASLKSQPYAERSQAEWGAMLRTKQLAAVGKPRLSSGERHHAGAEAAANSWQRMQGAVKTNHKATFESSFS